MLKTMVMIGDGEKDVAEKDATIALVSIMEKRERILPLSHLQHSNRLTTAASTVRMAFHF